MLIKLQHLVLRDGKNRMGFVKNCSTVKHFDLNSHPSLSRLKWSFEINQHSPSSSKIQKHSSHGVLWKFPNLLKIDNDIYYLERNGPLKNQHKLLLQPDDKKDKCHEDEIDLSSSHWQFCYAAYLTFFCSKLGKIKWLRNFLKRNLHKRERPQELCLFA